MNAIARYCVYSLVVLFAACNWAKQKTKETVNKTGEVIAATGSEFVAGATKGIEKTFSHEAKISEQLSKKGLRVGKISVHSSDTAADNILTAYMVFDGDIDQKITLKIFTETNKEYGRHSEMIAGKKGDARNVDFVFDKRTNIDSKGGVIFE